VQTAYRGGRVWHMNQNMVTHPSVCGGCLSVQWYVHPHYFKNETNPKPGHTGPKTLPSFSAESLASPCLRQMDQGR
jgi:hypothetical protein